MWPVFPSAKARPRIAALRASIRATNHELMNSLAHQDAHPIAGAGIAPELAAPLRAVLRRGEIEAELERLHVLRRRARQPRDAGRRCPRIALAGRRIEHREGIAAV